MSKQGAMIILCMVNFIAMVIPMSIALAFYMDIDIDRDNASFDLVGLSLVMFIDMCAFYALGATDE